MLQAVVCRRLPALRSASVVEYWNTPCAQRRSCLSYLRGCSDRQAGMQENLSCTLSQLSSSEPVAIVRVSGCLPGLHSIHLHRLRPRLTGAPLPSLAAPPALDLSITLGSADPRPSSSPG